MSAREPLSPEEAAEAEAIWAERDRRIAARWPDLTPVPLSPERLAEAKNLLRYESSISFHSARAKESMLLVVAEVDRLTALLEFEKEDAASLRTKVGDRNATIDRLSTRIGELEAELAKYVGKEPTLTEEMQYVGSCLDAVYDLVNGAKKRGHEVVTTAEVEQAASGDWPRDPKDNRRSIYVDGKGNAWISCATDEAGVEYVIEVDESVGEEKPLDTVRSETGGLREIGRCW
jgi:hypothetical protein